MIPTDIMPQRVPGPAVSGASQKGGNKNSGDREDASFAHAMKKAAGDKNASAQVTSGDKQAKVGALARWHRPELRGGLSADGETDGEEANSLDDGETGPGDEKNDGGDGPMQVTSGLSAAHSILSAMRLHAHPASGSHAARTKEETRSAGAHVADAGDVDADANAIQSVADVKVLDVKVETHLGGSRTEAAAAASAESLAHLGVQRQGQAKKADASTSGVVAPGHDKSAQKVSALPMPADAASQQPVAGLPDQTDAQSFRHGERHDGGDMKPPAELADVRVTKTVEDKVGGATSGVSAPLLQIGPQITATAQEMKAAAAEAAKSATNTPADAGNAGPVRVLNIDLHPADLGSVSVRMSMHGDTLGVQIEAERPETARMLQSDQGALTDMLRTAGLQVDGVTVRAANMDTVAAGTGSSQAYMQQDSQSGGAQSDARASGGNGQGRDAQSFAGRQGGGGQPDDDRPQRGAGGGLYI